MLKSPFPWFGGKSKAASLIWSRLGSDCGNYVEPFFGSGAVWHNRPSSFMGWAVVNDLDGNLANVWRSMQASPEAVAEAAFWPVNEADLHARHLWLVRNLPALSARLMADPEYHEPRTAGWWIWGACCWIGSDWCSGSGAWGTVQDSEGVPVFARAEGDGVKRKIPHLGGWTGVNRQIPHLGNGGTGVARQIPHLGNGGKGVARQIPMLTCSNGAHSEKPSNRLAWIRAWFADLQKSMEGVRVCCGDWERVCSVGSMTRNGTCAVMLDPPYSQTAAVYAHDSSTVAHDVRRWCEANGHDKRLRIALCGHAGEHEALEAQGWQVETWASKGYQGADDRERIWFSPFCVQPDRDLFA